MTVEERLRDALAASVETVHPAPDAWEQIARRARRARSHPRRAAQPARLRPAAFAVAAAVLTLSAALFAVSRDRVVDPAAQLGPAPEELIARSERGDLVVLDATTGEPRRTIARAEDLGANVVNVAVTPDHETVFFDTGAGPDSCGGGVYQLDADGGPATMLVPDASSPAVTPDGHRLAVVAGTDPLNCSIVVVNLGGGGQTSFAYPPLTRDELAPPTVNNLNPVCELSWPDPAPRPVLFPGSYSSGLLAWNDGRHVAFVTSEGRGRLEGPEQLSRVRVLDTEDARSLDDAVLVGPPVLGATVSTYGWWSVGWLDAGTLWTLGSDRCGPPPSGPRRGGGFVGMDQREEPQQKLHTVDVRTGEVDEVASFRTSKVAPSRLTVAASGHPAWTTWEGDVQTLRDGRVVTIVDASEGGGYSSVAW